MKRILQQNHLVTKVDFKGSICVFNHILKLGTRGLLETRATLVKIISETSSNFGTLFPLDDTNKFFCLVDVPTLSGDDTAGVGRMDATAHTTSAYLHLTFKQNPE